jgi:hypothetical protein
VLRHLGRDKPQAKPPEPDDGEDEGADAILPRLRGAVGMVPTDATAVMVSSPPGHVPYEAVRALARSGPVWADAPGIDADEAIDLMVAGAGRIVLEPGTRGFDEALDALGPQGVLLRLARREDEELARRLGCAVLVAGGPPGLGVAAYRLEGDRLVQVEPGPPDEEE